MSLPLRKSWTAVDTGLLGLLMVVWVCAFRHALIDVLMIGYRRQEQSHIILVPIVALWLLWIRRSRILSLRVSRSLWGPAIVALGIGAWAAGMAWDVQVLWHLAPVISLVGVVASLMGLGAVRRFAPVFGALLFLVPVPGAARQALTLPLQSLAAMSTEFTLSIMGVDAIRAANQLAVNGIPVEVGEECNGMRMVCALTLVVYAFVFSTPLRPGVRVVLLALSPVVALVSNVIRLISTALMVGYSTPDHAEMFHDLSGWAMLPIAMLMLVGVLRAIRWIELPVMSFRLTMR